VTNFDPNDVDYEAAEREMQATLDSTDALEGLTHVEAKIGKNLTDLVTFRMRADEFAEIDRAASRQGMTLSEFMRQAGLTRARESQGLPMLTPSLASTLDQLTSQYQELRRRPRISHARGKAKSK
jgi:hypothetical protein